MSTCFNFSSSGVFGFFTSLPPPSNLIFDLHPFWASSFPWQVLQFTPKTFAPALLHQLSRTGFPIHTEDFRSSAAPPTVKDGFTNSHRRLSPQRCATNCQGQVFLFAPKTFATALLHQLSRTGFPFRTEVFRASAAPLTVKDRFSNSHQRLSLQRCSSNYKGQVLQFTHTQNFRSSAAPPTVKDRFSYSHRRLSCQRCSLSLTVGGAALERKFSV